MDRLNSYEFGKRVGVNRSPRTLEKYDIAFSHLERFINHHYHVSDVPFRQLDQSFIENYDYYLRIKCRMMPNTLLHKMKALRRMVRIAITKGIIGSDPFAGYTPQYPKPKQRYLSQSDLDKMIDLLLDSPAQDFARDMFVFASFTGLAYIDMRKLTREQIVKADDGTLWLMTSRQKTGSTSNIPLLEIPSGILTKYDGHGKEDKVFPMTTLTVLNVHLKTIARKCGINRQLSFHTARHTIFSFLLKISKLQASFS